MLQKTTVDKITDWAQQKFAGGAPSLLGAAQAPSATGGSASGGGGMLSAVSAPAPKLDTTTPPLAQAAAPAVKMDHTGMPSMGATRVTASGSAAAKAPAAAPANVSDWYRTTLGRDGDAAGINFWQSAIKDGMKPEDAYAAFQQSATANQEIVKPTEWAKANSYRGPQSSDRSTPVDDWARNVLGRNLTAGELATWNGRYNAAGASGGPEAAKAVYQQFLDANKGAIKNPMDIHAASQIKFDANPLVGTGPTLINPGDLHHRTIDPRTETVRGQLQDVLAEDGPLMQQARADAMRTAADRGMLNSAMAASGGTDALIRSALQVATPDAGFYNRSADYNAAVDNQTLMYNATTQNDFARQQIGIDADAKSRADQFAQEDKARGEQLGQQMSLAQMQDATTRYNAELSNATSRYNTDQGYKQQVESNKKSLVNNIIANMELSPDRKAAMLEQLGEGTSARRDADGHIIPGSGLAGAVYVIDSIRQDLRGPGTKLPFLGGD